MIRSKKDILEEIATRKKKLEAVNKIENRLHDRITELQGRYEKVGDIAYKQRERLAALRGFLAIMNEREQETIELA